MFGFLISEAEFLILAIVLVAFAGVVMYFFARMLLVNVQSASQLEQPVTTLMSILGIISIVALIGALFTQSESAFTIAATGVGAFAGALTARTVSGAEKPAAGEGPEDEQTEPPEQEDEHA